MIERRKYQRVVIRLDVRWEGASGVYQTSISDISLGGCYVESISPVMLGENIRLKIKLPTDSWLNLRGEVRYTHPGIGFGVQFWPMKPAEWELWQAFLEYASSSGISY